MVSLNNFMVEVISNAAVKKLKEKFLENLQKHTQKLVFEQ